MVNFSNYIFTDPIRYFKENDPYYWEVDNIPLKQLQENCLWLKDQIVNTAAADGIDRSEFNELKPYAEGNSNVVKVKKGRFTARINDAYRKDPLQKLTLLTGTNLGDLESYGNPSGIELAQSFVSRLQSTLNSDSLKLNGLVERVNSWAVFNEDLVATTQIVNNLPTANSVNASVKWPLLSNFDFFSTVVQSLGAAYDLPRIAAEFTKQFRGVARTAVVDVPAELSIQIPNFDPNDFFTVDANGNKTILTNATRRIDLLFVYSKPVDASSTTVQSWSGGQPITITRPVLGLVRGAGVGISRTNFAVGPARDAVGNTQIMADPKDSAQTTLGFQGSSIYGSFPSPDDLMNLAPLISERLADNDPQLIGQTILPLAYIVVNKNSTLNTLGNIIVTNNHILDIRPFFRTTELTYNERAGLAAAIPAPSLANPVATQFVVDNQINGIRQYVDTQIASLAGDVGEINTVFVKPRTVAGGTIWGGLTFGPEGAINAKLQGLGAPIAYTNNNVPVLPDWDLADWWDFERPTANAADPGTKGTDRINYSFPFSDVATVNLLTNGQIYAWVKKKINIDRTQVPWMTDYEVKINLKNCGFITNGDRFERSIATGTSTDTITNYGVQNIYYEKFDTYFVIYVFFPYFSGGGVFSPTNNFSPINNRDNPLKRVFAHSTLFPYPTTNNGYDITDTLPAVGGGVNSISNFRSKEPFVQTCVYPTVSFEVIGYPSNAYQSMLSQSSTPSIVLR